MTEQTERTASPREPTTEAGIVETLHRYECDEEPLGHPYAEHLPEDEPIYHPNRIDALVELVELARAEGHREAVRDLKARAFEYWENGESEYVFHPNLFWSWLDDVARHDPAPAPQSRKVPVSDDFRPPSRPHFLDQMADPDVQPEEPSDGE